MKRRIMKLSLIVSALALLCLVPTLIRVRAKVTSTQQVVRDQGVESKTRPTGRKCIFKDLGTFGGPSSSVAFYAQVLNNKGTVVGGADTSIPDPFFPNC